MSDYTTTKRYCPHLITTKINAVKLYRLEKDIDFVCRRYAPTTIQTDNGGEFTNTKKTDRVHIFDKFCRYYNTTHKLIRPKTPWHNGKVERIHRNDQERFYNYLSFYSYEDLLIQMKRYLYRSNRIPMSVWDGNHPGKKNW